MIITIHDKAELDAHRAAIESATSRAMEAVLGSGSAVDQMRRMKFEAVGFHPIDGRALNLIEQVNQTFTFLVAFAATEWLLDRHPDAGGFRLAPGATMALPLDIMSIEPDLVGAETFAATTPMSNRKLAKDVQKLQASTATYRYAFFYSPGYDAGRVTKLERAAGVEVHCVDIEIDRVSRSLRQIATLSRF